MFLKIVDTGGTPYLINTKDICYIVSRQELCIVLKNMRIESATPFDEIEKQLKPSQDKP